MKTRILAALLIFALALSLQTVIAADKSAAATELDALIGKIRTKLSAGQKTKDDLAPELKELDALLAKHKDEKTDDTAQILLMEATLFLQVLDNNDKGVGLIKQLQRDYPDTKPAQNADKMLASMKKQAEAKKIKAAGFGTVRIVLTAMGQVQAFTQAVISAQSALQANEASYEVGV